MLDDFNQRVRRVANLLAYEQPVEESPLVVAAAKLYLSYEPFPMPNEPSRFGMETSGEFTAR